MLRSDAQRNVERLKAAALELFRERGLDAPLEEIARRAGVSAGTVYNRFGSREALIDAVVIDLAHSKLDPLLEHSRAGADPWDRFARFVDALLEIQVEDPALSDVLASPGTSPEVKAACGSALQEATRLIDHAHAAGVLRADFTRADLEALLVANAALIRAGGADAARRMTAYLLAGLTV